MQKRGVSAFMPLPLPPLQRQTKGLKTVNKKKGEMSDKPTTSDINLNLTAKFILRPSV